MKSKEHTLPKGLTFQQCDERLVWDILKYQEQNGLPTFIAAVRQLCYSGLNVK